MAQLATVTELSAKDRPGTPLWWVHKLAEKQNHRLAGHPALRASNPSYAGIVKYLRYFEGDHDLSFATPKFLEHFGGLFREFAVNICEVVVQAQVERMKVQGISFPLEDPDSKAIEVAHDPESWAMWQRNGMDAWSQIHFEHVAITGYGHIMVWGNEDDEAVITVEDPRQCIVAGKGPGRDAEAALKRWKDEWTGHEFATLFLPDSVHRFRSDQPVEGSGLSDATYFEVNWVYRSDDSVIDNPLGVVPIVEFANDPTILGEGRSEIRSIIPIQDAINKLVADMLVASEYGAYRQRYAIGLEAEVDEKTKKPKKPFEAAIERVWTMPNAEGKFGEFDATDLTNYTKAKESLLQDAAFISRTPRHYFTQSGQAPSGDSLKSSETGLVAKVKDREVPQSEQLEKVIRYGHLIEGNVAKANAFACEIKWVDPEYRTEGERTDSVIKQLQAGVIPWEYAVDRLGYSPTDIDKMRKMRASETLLKEGANLASLLSEDE